jgi:hypothetical protein
VSHADLVQRVAVALLSGRTLRTSRFLVGELKVAPRAKSAQANGIARFACVNANGDTLYAPEVWEEHRAHGSVRLQQQDYSAFGAAYAFCRAEDERAVRKALRKRP